MADMHTLRECPFCGGENLEFYYADIEGWIAHVRCIECDDMIGPMSECKYDDKFEAAEDATIAWNRRAPSHDAETVKALRDDRYDQGRRDVLNAILALNPKAAALLAGLHEREPNPLGQIPFDVAVWVTEVAEQLGIQPKDEARAALAGSAS